MTKPASVNSATIRVSGMRQKRTFQPRLQGSSITETVE